MSLISLGTGAPLRLRIHAGTRSFAKDDPADKRPLKPKRIPKTVPLFPEAGTVSTAEVRSERLARQVVQLILMNRINVEILERFNRMGIHDWWLAAGALFQTVWNLRSGRAAWQDINDYDVFYFSEDTTWEAEDLVIKDCERLFEDLNANVQVRNQSRVHLWYEDKYGIAYPALTNASEGIMRFPARCASIGIKRTGDEFLDLFVPFGLDDVWNLIVTPNRTLPIAHVYAEKTERWKKSWPTLTVHPWADDR
jgi:hypothetical protein